VKNSSLASRHHSLVCPHCERGLLRSSGENFMRCELCGERLSGALLETLRRITALPDTLGSHACEECGHPEMRLLPDGVFHCSACGSEVLPIDTSLTSFQGKG
jgi:ribosomal protein L37AE/L43A